MLARQYCNIIVFLKVCFHLGPHQNDRPVRRRKDCREDLSGRFTALCQRIVVFACLRRFRSKLLGFFIVLVCVFKRNVLVPVWTKSKASSFTLERVCVLGSFGGLQQGYIFTIQRLKQDICSEFCFVKRARFSMGYQNKNCQCKNCLCSSLQRFKFVISCYFLVPSTESFEVVIMCCLDRVVAFSQTVRGNRSVKTVD